jgi:predicted DNA-binding ribbon-helix-helix protein
MDTKDARTVVEAAQTESEATRDQPLPEAVRGERRGRSVVQSVRLPAEEFAEIERIAAQAGVPVGALIRGWVLAGLAAERGTSLRDAIEHLAEEAQRLRRLAALSDVA